MAHGEIVDAEHFAVAGRALDMREKRVDVAAHHGGHDLLVGKRPLVEAGGDRAVAHHGDAIGHLGDFGQAMRDEDAGDAAGLQMANDLEQVDRLIVGERGGGFVEDQHLGLQRQGPGDHQQVPLGGRQGRSQAPRIEADIGIGQDFFGPGAHGGGADDEAALGEVADQDVFGHGQRVDHRDFLRHIADALPQRIVGRAKLGQLAVEEHSAFVAAGRVDANQYLHQRRLTGAVFADHGVNLPAANLQRNAFERVHAGKSLGHLLGAARYRAGRRQVAFRLAS